MDGESTGNWQQRAERLGKHFPFSVFHPSTSTWIRENSDSTQPVGVAVSGGADSLCLLLLLWCHLPEWRKRLHVLHFDHQLRGAESRADRDFVEKVSIDLGLAVFIGKWKRSEEEPVSEESARLARLAFFHQQLKSIGAEAPAIFFGHQRDDIAENLLMRLSRGSGAGGLSGPRPVQYFRDGRVHLRPLLDLSAKAIHDALINLKIPFRIDATNSRPGFYRNRLRDQVIPAWQTASPRTFDVGRGAALARKLLDEDDFALREWLRELLPESENREKLDFRPLFGKPRALHRRALHEWLRRQKLTANLTRSAVDLLLDAIDNRKAKTISAGTGVQLTISSDGLLRKTILEKPEKSDFPEPWPLPMSGILLLPQRRQLQARRQKLDPMLRESILGGRVDEQKEAFLALETEELSVRNWLPGDRYRPIGAPGAKKLHDLFIDRKVPAKERVRLPVVLLSNRPVWVPGFPPADALRINRFTKIVVQLTYSHDGPV